MSGAFVLALALVAQPSDYDFLNINKKLDAIGEQVTKLDEKVTKRLADLEVKLDRIALGEAASKFRLDKMVAKAAPAPAKLATSPQVVTTTSTITPDWAAVRYYPGTELTPAYYTPVMYTPATGPYGMQSISSPYASTGYGMFYGAPTGGGGRVRPGLFGGGRIFRGGMSCAGGSCGG